MCCSCKFKSVLRSGQTMCAHLMLSIVQAIRHDSQIVPLRRPGDTRSEEERKPLRAGYVGHITQISNCLIQLANDGQQQVRRQGGGRWKLAVGRRTAERGMRILVLSGKGELAAQLRFDAGPLHSSNEQACLTCCPHPLSSYVRQWTLRSAGSSL